MYFTVYSSLGKKDIKTLGVTALMTAVLGLPPWLGIIFAFPCTINVEGRVNACQTTRKIEKLAQNRMK